MNPNALRTYSACCNESLDIVLNNKIYFHENKCKLGHNGLRHMFTPMLRIISTKIHFGMPTFFSMMSYVSYG